MAVPASGNQLSLQGIRRELEVNNYSSTNTYTDISLEDLSDGTVATINTGNDAADRPDGSAPHKMSEFYSYDHDIAVATVPTLGYSSGNIDDLVITWDMAGGNTKVYFQLVSSEIGHVDIAAGDYDNTTLEIDGEEFQTSAGSHNILGGSTTVDDGNEDMGTGNFPNKSITIKARGRALDNSYSSFSSNFVAYVAPGPTTGLTVSSVSSTGMTISWSAPQGGVRSTNGYRLYHGTNTTWHNNANFDIAVNSSVTSKTYTGLSASTTYYFGVITVGDGGDFGRTASMQNGSQVTTSGGGFGVPSDRRLKTNIEPIGKSSTGIPIYLFNYKNDLSTKYKGVMAQDLLSMEITEPVGKKDGYYTVDYNKIDVDLEII